MRFLCLKETLTLENLEKGKLPSIHPVTNYIISNKKKLHTLSSVGASPKVTNYFVDFFHLHAMKCHYCSNEEQQKIEIVIDAAMDYRSFKEASAPFPFPKHFY